MNTAVATLESAPAPSSPLLTGFARLDLRTRVALALGLLALVAVLSWAYYMARESNYRVLFANLSEKDGGAVIAQLAQMNIPYRYTEGGGAILVPSDKVHDTRLKLASQGLPKGNVAGYEQMETSRLGMTQFQERLSFQRGLEGELTRSINSLDAVMESRVHLALPNQNGFFREQQKPSASVLLTLYPGRKLDRAQIAGIVHLVASSVPEMNPKAVSVVDQTGALLSSGGDGTQAVGVDTKQLEYTQQLEQMYVQRILDLLEPLVGRDNVRARVTADVDFSLLEQTSEQHKPNQGTEPSAVRSQQTVESGSAAALSAAGVPGAVSNQPPGPSAAPINGQAAAVGVQGAGAGGTDGSLRRESLVNYEVDRTVQVLRGTGNTLRRLSAAVVINHRSTTDTRGRVSTNPIPAEQLDQMRNLIREAVGFSETRGDSLNVMNSPFTVPEVQEIEIPLWQQPEVQDFARSMVWPIGFLVVGLALFFGLLRPAFRTLQTSVATASAERTAGGGKLSAVLDDEPERPSLPPVRSTEPQVTEHTLRLDDAKRLAKENPVAVANIIKGWVNQEAGTALATT